MRAWYIDDESPITQAELQAEGIVNASLGTDASLYQPQLDALRARQGYLVQDEIALSPSTENLSGILAKFWPEHHHDDDEVRFVLSGAGIFDIRNHADRWMRVVVVPGDLIVVPNGRHHRFELTDERHIRCARLFKDKAGWTPVYREGAAPGQPPARTP